MILFILTKDVAIEVNITFIASVSIIRPMYVLSNIIMSVLSNAFPCVNRAYGTPFVLNRASYNNEFRPSSESNPSNDGLALDHFVRSDRKLVVPNQILSSKRTVSTPVSTKFKDTYMA